jgi:hypothetical protein
VLYVHNSDHPFDEKYRDIVEDSRITHIFAQNIDYPKDIGKLTLLPIGIANSMWKHGDLVSLYKVMTDVYKNKKTKNIYVNINPSTYEYRRDILDAIKRSGCWPLAASKQYIEYLKELGEHRFCLCIRGNGLDTHRFWECLYLGVIPVIIVNKTTKLDNFLTYVKKLNIPYVSIQDDDLDLLCKKHTIDNFGEQRYYSIIKQSGSSMYYNPSLKVSNYYR